MGLFKKKRLSPEELEEKSKREKEWADKCYRAGERFGRKYNFAQKVERINSYANTYPRTFFTILLGIILGCFVLNMVFVGFGYSAGEQIQTDIEAVTIRPDRSKDKLNREINSLYKEMEHYNSYLEELTRKDSLTHEDSIAIGKVIVKMKHLNEIIHGKEAANEKD